MKIVVTAGLLAIVVLPATGWAQSGELQGRRIEEVVVTAQKREQALTDVPLTVQALDGDFLERGRIGSLKEIIPLVPGMSLAGETSHGSRVYQLRGIAVGDVLGDATVASYLDDFAFSIPGAPYAPPADLYDVERVEIIKGPQGTLYGSSSLGGVVKIVTRNPVLNEFGLNLQGSTGKVHTAGYDHSVSAAVNVPLIEDKLAIRGVVSTQRLSGFSHAPALGKKDINDSTTEVGRVKLLYQHSDRLRINLGVMRFDAEQDWFNRMEDEDPYIANETGPGSSLGDFNLYQGRVEYDFDFATLTSATGYIERDSFNEANGCQVQLCYSQILPGESTSFVQELRLSSAGEGLIDWMVGAFYQEGEAIATGQLVYTNPPGLSLPGLPFSTSRDNSLESEEYAAFGEISVNLLDGRLVPLLGLRYARTERALQQFSITTVPGDDPVVIDEGADARWNDVSPRFNVSFFPNDDLMLFANVAKGFRPGALQSGSQTTALERVLNVDTEVQLDTDELWNYEAGLKWSLWDGAANIDLSAYYSDWSDAQLQTGYSGIVGIFNVADIEGTGLDLSVIMRPPVAGLTLLLSGNVNSTKMKNVNENVEAALPFFTDGAQLPPVPKKNLTFAINHVLPVQLGGTSFDLVTDARYQYRDSNKDISTGLESGVLDIFSASVGLESDTYSLQLFADNITNERGPTLWEQARIVVPRPRTVGLQVSYDL